MTGILGKIPRRNHRSSVPLHFQTFGQGPPLIILHGLFGTGGNWRSIARRLATGRRVWTVDLRNHGASPHAEPMDYDTMAGDILLLLEHERLESAALLGHSMGGKVAMTVALRHPTRVQALIVVDIAPVRYPNRVGPLITAMQGLPLQALPDRDAADRQLAQKVPDTQLRQYLLQNLVRSDRGFRWRMNIDAIASALDEILGFPEVNTGVSYPGPCCFINGERSDYVLPQHDGVLAERFPRARRVTIPGAGHWLNAEYPEVLIANIENFLANLEPSTAYDR